MSLKDLKILSLKITNLFLDFIFPKKCLSCKKEGVFLCKNCLSKIQIKNYQDCPICRRKETNGELCISCKSKNQTLKINQLIVSCDYNDKLLQKSIHTFKYKFIPELSVELSILMQKSFLKNNLKIPDLIIPVPLHPRRLRWRGFNQSHLLAQTFCKNLIPNLTIEVNTTLLKRSLYTKSQMSLKNKSQREKNIKNAFSINKKYAFNLKRKNILLIDDVCTSGSTLFEIAKELSKYNPKSINAIVLARQN